MNRDDLVWIADELKISDDSQRRHVENIHILITTLIVASYFTPSVQEIITEQGIQSYTNFLFFISILYLGIRLVDITIPIRQFHAYIDWTFGFIAPLGFLFSVLGYLGMILLSIADVDLTNRVENITAIITILLALTLTLLELRKSKKHKEKLNKIESVDPDNWKINSVLSFVLDFHEFVYNNPENIEEGLNWDDEYKTENLDINSRFDLIGTDKERNTVCGELKLAPVNRSRIDDVIATFKMFKKYHTSDSRFLLITNEEPHTSAKDVLEEYPIEVKKVDYEV